MNVITKEVVITVYANVKQDIKEMIVQKNIVKMNVLVMESVQILNVSVNKNTQVSIVQFKNVLEIVRV